MVVRVLDVVEYSDGYHWEEREVHAPTWEQIEEAVRNLDKHYCPFVILRLQEHVTDYDRLEIMGGQGAYRPQWDPSGEPAFWVAGSFKGYQQRRLLNPNGGNQEIAVWTSDQGFADEDRFVCRDLRVVLQVARYFAEVGDFDPSVAWEEQRPPLRPAGAV